MNITELAAKVAELSIAKERLENEINELEIPIVARWRKLGGGNRNHFTSWHLNGDGNVVVTYEWHDGDHGEDVFPASVFTEGDDQKAVQMWKEHCGREADAFQSELLAKEEAEERAKYEELRAKFEV